MSESFLCNGVNTDWGRDAAVARAPFLSSAAVRAFTSPTAR